MINHIYIRSDDLLITINPFLIFTRERTSHDKALLLILSCIMFRLRTRFRSLYSNFFFINKQPLIISSRKYSKHTHPSSSEIIKLSYTQFDPLKFHEESHERPYLIILHGLFGSKQNWKSLAKNFAQQLNTRVFTLVFIISTFTKSIFF